MKLRSKIFWLGCVLLLPFISRAQDIHFSQYNMSPLNLNPAFTGFFDGEYRFGANYRTQWTKVPVPYNTFSGMADMRMPFKKIQGDYTGLGLVFNNDISGDGHYGTTQVYIPLSYIKKVSGDSSLLFSAGIQPGISNIGFRTANLTYDNQYDGDAYNPSLPSGENYAQLSRTYFDINAGGLLSWSLNQRASMIGGVSFSHLTMPRVSYYKNEAIRLDLKTAAYLSFSYGISARVKAVTEVLYEKQGKYSETVFGERISFIVNPKEKQAVNAGAYLRAKDAVIARIGYDYKSWQFGMSYDVNTSQFKAATNRRGAIEFSLIYIFKKESLFTPKKRVCPVYM